jgi:hypothetical protein
VPSNAKRGACLLPLPRSCSTSGLRDALETLIYILLRIQQRHNQVQGFLHQFAGSPDPRLQVALAVVQAAYVVAQNHAAPVNGRGASRPLSFRT